MPNPRSASLPWQQDPQPSSSCLVQAQHCLCSHWGTKRHTGAWEAQTLVSYQHPCTTHKKGEIQEITDTQRQLSQNKEAPMQTTQHGERRALPSQSFPGPTAGPQHIEHHRRASPPWHCHEHGHCWRGQNGAQPLNELGGKIQQCPPAVTGHDLQPSTEEKASSEAESGAKPRTQPSLLHSQKRFLCHCTTTPP